MIVIYFQYGVLDRRLELQNKWYWHWIGQKIDREKRLQKTPRIWPGEQPLYFDLWWEWKCSSNSFPTTNTQHPHLVGYLFETICEKNIIWAVPPPFQLYQTFPLNSPFSESSKNLTRWPTSLLWFMIRLRGLF